MSKKPHKYVKRIDLQLMINLSHIILNLFKASYVQSFERFISTNLLGPNISSN